MNTDTENYTAFRGHPLIALHHSVLYLDGAAHCVDDAAELDDCAVAGAFDDSAVMGSDGGID
jgi:hypothetical protein